MCDWFTHARPHLERFHKMTEPHLKKAQTTFKYHQQKAQQSLDLKRRTKRALRYAISTPFRYLGSTRPVRWTKWGLVAGSLSYLGYVYGTYYQSELTVSSQPIA